MPLQYLIFDTSDNGDGTGTWDAVASVRAAQWPEVLEEVRTVMAWADAHAPGERGPLDDGGVWDADEQTQVDGEWTTVTLTLTGPWTWGEALVAHFAPRD
ncbi:hypothetical protein [Hydrogenophaga sp. BPS33]|uniref:hypothetical protein n=1 Tax=Hydrogenophaga sp. BPS33 TaxID=2651974 RepID=UPI0013203AEC|nr:hypothetical protein [Hydrogenophaga sp. BPS33]QHE88377.1 hypothetical protein F9K07_27585 [Hydrogenophaga sp. BPS33]